MLGNRSTGNIAAINIKCCDPCQAKLGGRAERLHTQRWTLNRHSINLLWMIKMRQIHEPQIQSSISRTTPATTWIAAFDVLKKLEIKHVKNGINLLFTHLQPFKCSVSLYLARPPPPEPLSSELSPLVYILPPRPINSMIFQIQWKVFPQKRYNM